MPSLQKVFAKAGLWDLHQLWIEQEVKTVNRPKKWLQRTVLRKPLLTDISTIICKPLSCLTAELFRILQKHLPVRALFLKEILPRPNKPNTDPPTYPAPNTYYLPYTSKITYTKFPMAKSIYRLYPFYKNSCVFSLSPLLFESILISFCI